MSALRAVRDAALFCGSCALVCAAIYHALPFPRPPGISQKYLHFAQHRDAYDTIFVGSSRFYHHIIPRQFDAAVAAATGQQLRSFNFGYDAMWPPESYYMLRQILALRPTRLRWVFIDLMDIDQKLNEQYTGTMRMAYWHDWRHTRLAVEEILRSTGPTLGQSRLLADHAALFAKQLLNFGRGAEWFEDRLAWKKKDWAPPKDWRETEGYKAGPADPLPADARGDFVQRVSGLKTDPPLAQLSPVLHAAMTDLIAEVRAAGAQPIFVLSPTVLAREFFAPPPTGAQFIAFNDPQKYPQLYDPEVRYDTWHFNPRGAALFTDLLAERFALLLKGPP